MPLEVIGRMFGQNSLPRKKFLKEARHEQGISQKKLEELSGVSQPVIARMETGKTSPQLDTVLKVLASLGKTLAVVPLEQEKS